MGEEKKIIIGFFLRIFWTLKFTAYNYELECSKMHDLLGSILITSIEHASTFPASLIKVNFDRANIRWLLPLITGFTQHANMWKMQGEMGNSLSLCNDNNKLITTVTHVQLIRVKFACRGTCQFCWILVNSAVNQWWTNLKEENSCIVENTKDRMIIIFI